jgi:hypothetical protein
MSELCRPERAGSRSEPLNSPNDVVVKSDDSVWSTDPPFGIQGNYEGCATGLGSKAQLMTRAYAARVQNLREPRCQLRDRARRRRASRKPSSNRRREAPLAPHASRPKLSGAEHPGSRIKAWARNNITRASATRAAFVLVQLAAVLPGRAVEPASTGAEEAALVGEAEQVRRLTKRKMQPAEVLLREFAARVV